MTTPKSASLRKEDLRFLSPIKHAEVVESAPAAMWAVYLLLAAIVAAALWAWIARVDIVARAPARVVPDGREQVIASFEGGILRELRVKEGDKVGVGDELALLDPTRFVAQQAEGDARRVALRGMIARLEAEAQGSNLVFPPDVVAVPSVANGERKSYEARLKSLEVGLRVNRQNEALLQNELNVAESLSKKGLMSEVEVMRLRRQLNDLQLQTQVWINRHRQDALAELVKARTDLSQLDEQQVVRKDALQRTVLTSPVRGIIKTIKVNTLGGVVPAGAPVMEVVPIGPRVLIEARIRPADIGFVKVGQEATVKLSAYEYTVYGGLEGKVQSISPDAIGDADKPQGAEGTYYRALIRAERPNLQVGGKKLEILPGMSGTVDIRTGERSVMDFILRPMLRSQEAFQER